MARKTFKLRREIENNIKIEVNGKLSASPNFPIPNYIKKIYPIAAILCGSFQNQTHDPRNIEEMYGKLQNLITPAPVTPPLCRLPRGKAESTCINFIEK